MEHTNKMRGKKRYTAITVFLYMLVCQRETLAFYSECVHEGLRLDCSHRNLTSMPKDTQHMNLEYLFLDLRGNFKQKYKMNDWNCELGCNKVDTQEHLLICEELADSAVSSLQVANYDDLFSNQLGNQLNVASILRERSV